MRVDTLCEKAHDQPARKKNNVPDKFGFNRVDFARKLKELKGRSGAVAYFFS
jgi:hypothetical protein